MKTIAKHLKIENPQHRVKLLLIEIEELYLNLSTFCFKLKIYDESILYGNIALKFLKDSLNDIDLKLKFQKSLKNLQNLTDFYDRKKIILSSVYFFLSKAHEKEKNYLKAFELSENSCKVIKEVKFENSELFQKKYEKNKNLIYLNMESSLKQKKLFSNRESESNRRSIVSSKFLKTYAEENKNHKSFSIMEEDVERKENKNEKKSSFNPWNSPQLKIFQNEKKRRFSLDQSADNIKKHSFSSKYKFNKYNFNQ